MMNENIEIVLNGIEAPEIIDYNINQEIVRMVDRYNNFDYKPLTRVVREEANYILFEIENYIKNIPSNFDTNEEYRNTVLYIMSNLCVFDFRRKSF